MISTFFIHRPIASLVISILITLAGAICFQAVLPVAQYPDITPPVVRVATTYPGASAQVISDTVAAPIEQEVNGVDGMLYMSSTSASDGTYNLDVTFALGTDPDLASVLVQNRVNAAQPKLPEEVKRQGVTTKKQSTNIIAVVSFDSPGNSYDDTFLANYVTQSIKDPLTRLDGVGSIQVIPGKDYAMRLWLDPAELEARRLTTNDVVNAVREQNVQVAAGAIGRPPSPNVDPFQLAINTLGRLSEPKEFEQIILQVNEDGGVTRLSDVARVELGAKSYDTISYLNDRPAASLLIYQSPGSNAVATAKQIREELETLTANAPADLSYKVVYDISDFIESSINEVYVTLFQAFGLVVIVVLIFLQDWRTTLVPSITIPVALIGTFAAMAAFGFSINMLTLFGLVLAIGVVVDDAIVVVESVQRKMGESEISSYQAAEETMREVTGPIIATSLVLMAVFVPASLIPGLTGQLYRQFALTIAASTLFSTINALTLSPALAALLLKRPDPNRKPNPLAGLLGGLTKVVGLVFKPFTASFNWSFDRLTSVYTAIVRLTVRRLLISIPIFVILIGVTGYRFGQIPGGFLPIEDQGLVLIDVKLPDAASLGRTDAVIQEIGEILGQTDGVLDSTLFAGYSLLSGGGSNNGLAFAVLEPWGDRLPRGRNLRAIILELRQKFQAIQEAQILVLTLPAIPGLGSNSGFDLRILDDGGAGRQALGTATEQMIADANTQSSLRAVNTTFSIGVPQLFAEIDREKVKRLGIPLQDVFSTLQAYLGSAYVNDFNLFGRTYQVNLQAEGKYRTDIRDIRRLEVRAPDGQMVPLASLMTIRNDLGPERVKRYNLKTSAQVNGEAAPGTSSGESLDLMESLAGAILPPGMTYAWSGVSYQERAVSNSALLVFALGGVVIYLILAFQYESWLIPLAVIMTVPLAVLGAMIALVARQFDNNVYTQVGLLLLIALSAKNAILIVEFARQRRDGGEDLIDSAVGAARMRFRPILMTSLTFILGVFPLVIASGAGAAGRQAVGTAVFGGMIGATFLGIFFTPMHFVTIQGLGEFLSGRSRRPTKPQPNPEPHLTEPQPGPFQDLSRDPSS